MALGAHNASGVASRGPAFGEVWWNHIFGPWCPANKSGVIVCGSHESTQCTSESPSQVFRDVVAGGISTAAVSAVLNPIDVADYLAHKVKLTMADKSFRLTSFAGLSQKGKAQSSLAFTLPRLGNELTVLCVDMQIYVIHSKKTCKQEQEGNHVWYRIIVQQKYAESGNTTLVKHPPKKWKTSVHRISIKRTLMSLSSTKSLEELLCEVKTRRQVGIPRTAIQEERASWPRRLMRGTRCNKTEQDWIFK